MSSCSKSKNEPPITGKRSDPPLSLRCVWKAGYRYQLRLEVAVLTDTGMPDPYGTALHRVTFAQDCLVSATNFAKGEGVGLDMEVLSVAMERAKGTQVALSFDSDQGGEACDDIGYIPVLQALVGGHLHFLISPEGKMLRATGINEWLARAFDDAPAPKLAVDRPPATAAPPNNGSLPTNAPAKTVRPAKSTVASASSKHRATVSNTVRNFFTPEHFRQMIEFNFLPVAAVRVGEEWKNQADIPIHGRGRFKFDAISQFDGWQQCRQTNCARVAVRAKVAASGSSSPAGALPKPDTLKATLWIDPQLSFPITTILDAQVPLDDPAPPGKQGTNNVVVKALPKSTHQYLTLTLLEVAPMPERPAEAKDGSIAP